MRACPECGAEVAPAMKFCAECGTKLEVGQSTVSYAPSFGEEVEPAAGRRRRGGPDRDGPGGGHGGAQDARPGRRGRHCRPRAGERIFLDDVTVSRKHAEIVHGDGGYRIRDVGSLNGTYVNRVRVDAVDLRNGDEIQVGKYRFRFVFS